MLEWIDNQIYCLALLAKYFQLHDIFSIQLLESYYHCENDNDLMIMSDLEDSSNKWKIEKVHDKRCIKDMIHYLIKWTDWLSEYNSYKSAAHLANIPEAVAAYKWKRKWAHRDWYFWYFDFNFYFDSYFKLEFARQIVYFVICQNV